MSAFDGDHRVTDMGGLGELFEFADFGGPSGTVYFDRGWRARLDGMAGSPQHTYDTADDALRSVVGDPQYLPLPTASAFEQIDRDR